MRFIVFFAAICLLTGTAKPDVWTFETPSENVQCTVGEGPAEEGILSDISCTIIERFGPPALPRPPSCTSSWGHVFSMRERGPVDIECGPHSTDRSGFDRADYGVTGKFGGFTCHSSKQGLRCTNRDGNGFFLSKRKQTVIGTGGVSDIGVDLQPTTYGATTAVNTVRPIPYDPNARWWMDFRQGTREAGVSAGVEAELIINCDLGSTFNSGSSISIFVGNAMAPAGSEGKMIFDDIHSAPIRFNDKNSIVVEDNNSSIGNFNFTIDSLKRYGTVLVRMPGGEQARFSLRGSSKAIGQCPATPTSRQLPDLKTESDAFKLSENHAGTLKSHAFNDYPSTASLNSTAIFPEFEGRDRNFRSYRTRIRDAVSQGVNFAGHYSFVTIGCGTECRFGFVVDLRNGMVFNFPYGGEEHYQMDLSFSRDSRLVKVRWKGDWQSETCTEKDLVVEGTTWRVLAERTVSPVDGSCFFPFAEKPDIPVSDESSTPILADTQTGQKPETAAIAKSAESQRASQTNIKQNTLQVSQEYLKTLGFGPGPADGVMNVETILAVNAFQKAYGLKVLGYLPPQHFAVLEALAKEKSSTLEPITGDRQSPSSDPQQGPKVDASSDVKSPNQDQETSGLQAITSKTEENDVTYHKLQGCNFERGLATVNYTRREGSDRTFEPELTEICFDRKSGTLWASESASGFTLVSQDQSVSQYEDLASTIGLSGKKGSISAGGFTPRLDRPDVRSEAVELFFSPTKPDVTKRMNFQQYSADDFSLMGYLFEKQALAENAKHKPYRIVVSGSDFGGIDTPSPPHHSRNVSSLDIHSDSLTFENSTAVLNKKTPDSYSKLVSGSLKLVLSPDGSIAGGGEFHIENSKLAGIEPHEWLSAKWEIKNLSGHLVGNNAAGFRAVGIATGSTVYKDGQVGEINGTISIIGRDLAYEEKMFGNYKK